MARKLEVLTPEQAQHFVDKGYVRVSGCLDPALAGSGRPRPTPVSATIPSSARPGPRTSSGWTATTRRRSRNISPKGWGAVCDVTGGEDRIDHHIMEIESQHFTTIDSTEWSDAFIVNFRRGADKPWAEPSAAAGGWHKDGSFFRHFLDSREQGLLTIVYWSDVGPKGGGTFIAPDSIKLVARYLADHPEGVDPSFDFGSLIDQCQEFEEVTGRGGRLHHPPPLHAARLLQQPLGPRPLHDQPAGGAEGADGLQPRRPRGVLSLIERATLHALGVERYDFQPTAPREEQWTILGYWQLRELGGCWLERGHALRRASVAPLLNRP